MTNYASYAKDLREELHCYPELGFDLPRTLALVRRELDSMGISYTEEYGPSSIVAVLQPEKSQFTIGIRADMDALPIEERHETPYRSQIPGQMHACGHDVHTAILLATARRLRDLGDQLACRVKLLFTPAEEYIQPGCQAMAENGVMDDIDCIVALHVDHNFPAGTVALRSGGEGGNSMGFTVEFFGKSSHAARQNLGCDAIAMGVEAYIAMELMAAKEVDPVEPWLLNIGSFHGGNTNNIICDYCKLFGSARTQNDQLSEFLIERIRQIAQRVAENRGGRAEVTVNKFLPYVINDEKITAWMRSSAETCLGPEKVLVNKRTMGGEDFSFLCRRKPGMMFRLGIKGGPESSYAVHTDCFDVDPACFQVGIDLFTQFVLDHMEETEV